MNIVRASICALILLLFGLPFAEAQSYYRNRNSQTLILTAGVGSAHYFGDLKDYGVLNTHINTNLGARYTIYPRLDVGVDFTWFMLAADDADSPVKSLRGLSFFSHNFEASAFFQYNLFEDPLRFYQRRMFNPYVFAGVGMLHFSPMTKYEGDVYRLRPLQTEGVKYSQFTVAFPFGLGIKYKLNAFFNISAQAGFRYTLTDYLDDVSSGVYPEPSSFEDPIARALSDRSAEAGADVPFAVEGRNVRGNPERRDNYLLVFIRAEFYLSPLSDSFRAIRYRGIRNKRRRRR